MSLAKTYKVFYAALSVEEVLTLLQNARAQRQAVLDEETSAARETYDAWPERGVSGYPFPFFGDHNFIAAHTLYRDLPPLLSYGLGLGRKRQDVTYAFLLDAVAKNLFTHFIKRSVAQYILERFQSDKTPLYEKGDEWERQYKEVGNAWSKIRNAQHEMGLWDEAIGLAQALPAHFAAYPALQTIVYLDRNILSRYNEGDLSQANAYPFLIQLSVENQQRVHARIHMAEDFDEQQRYMLQSSPNKQYADRLMGIMRATITGNSAVLLARELGTEILFCPFKEDEPIINLALYDPNDKKIRASQIERKEFYFDYAEVDAEQDAVNIVHEMEHRRQQHKFPALFSRELNITDAYVAVKLMETGAFAAHLTYVDERSRQTWCFGRPVSLKPITADFTERVSNEVLHDWLGIPAPANNGEVDWSLYQLAFMGNFIRTLRDPSIWANYEGQFVDSELGDFLRTGDFQNRVAASPFLQPDFLECFCVTPDGHSFLPAGRQAFFAAIVKEVATLHHPYLAGLAQKAREIAGLEIPLRESVAAINIPSQAARLDRA